MFLGQSQAALPICLPLIVAALRGFEPRFLAPEASVLPLDDKAVLSIVGRLRDLPESLSRSRGPTNYIIYQI